MSKLLVVDSEPSWCNHWRAQGVPVAETLAEALAAIRNGGIETVILDAHKLAFVPALNEAGVRVIVATGQLLTSREAIAAYRAGGVAYVAKDLRMTAGNLEAGAVRLRGGKGKSK